MTYQITSLKSLSKNELADGMRLCRVIAKKGQIGQKQMESQGVVLPAVSVGILNALVNDTAGREFLCNAVAGVQDSIVRKAVELGKMAIFDEQIGFGALIEAMTAENESVRFSKDGIAKWFDAALRANLSDAIKAKMAGISESNLDKLLANYVVQFQVLAQRAPSMDNNIKAQLVRAMEFVAVEYEDSDMTVEIATRLAAVQAASAMLCSL